MSVEEILDQKIRGGRLFREKTKFFLCDIQERLSPHVLAGDAVVSVAGFMIAFAKLMNISVVATEQYPRGLGKTVASLDMEGVHVYEKTKFSMVVPDVVENELNDVDSVVLFGVEAHICIQQTAFDLMALGIDVHVIVDGTSSQRSYDRMTAFDRMRHEGVYLTTTESAFLELVGDASDPQFKAVSALLREYKLANIDPQL